MKINLSFIHIYLIISALLLTSCAQQVPPNGGPKDEIAPKVIGSRPENKTLNFDAKKISIQLDEYIQIKDASQIVISPPMKDKPTISANGKQIEIEFYNNKPKSNTTYTINFGASIADIHEGSSLTNYSYVFSTGEYLDSNSISGVIETALERKVQKDVVVAMYKCSNFTDSTLAKELPGYFAKSNEDGNYKIENLPNDSFYIFCFKDLNSNLKVEPNEPCGFINEKINTALDSGKINLRIYEPHTYKPGTIVESFSKQKSKYQFVTYDLSKIKIEALDTFVKYSTISAGINGIDTLNYFSTIKEDTLSAKFRIITLDSTYVLNIKTKVKAKLPSFKIEFENPKRPTDTLALVSSIPMENIDWNRLTIKRDTLEIKPKSIHNYSPTTWKIVLPNEEGAFFQLSLKDSSCKSILGQYNVALNGTYSPRSEKDFGSVILDLNYSDTEPFLLELVEDKESGKVVYSTIVSKSKLIEIKNLEPSTYKIRFIKDTNKNGKWDRGILKDRILPEQVYYFNNTITVKAYWDIEQSIDLLKILIY
ncbi:MAG: hypothetical protein FGM41_04735 [Bacteroidetes bacterium]|nr:hypothetical protein [Bacteroidota bacterium]